MTSYCVSAAAWAVYGCCELETNPSATPDQRQIRRCMLTAMRTTMKGDRRSRERMTSKTATNQNGHMIIMVIGEHVNKYLSLNKLGIIKSRTETMPEVDFKRNALH